MVKTKGHYHQHVSMLDWYYDRHKIIQDKKRMENIQEQLADSKLEVLNRLTTLQRVIIGLNTNFTDRDIKNLNSSINSVNNTYTALVKLLENK